MTKWDIRFVRIAKEVAEWSKDPSTQVGAIAVKNRKIIATGYNGFPKGIEDIRTRLHDRELKLKFTVHAEKNMIYNAVVEVKHNCHFIPTTRSILRQYFIDTVCMH